MKEGKLKPGDKLPPEQALAEKFGTSRPSVMEALSVLEILGITESRGSKGNFIKDTPGSRLYEQKDSKNAHKQVYHHLAGVEKDLLRN
ncbi:MAG: GntR family transcriptional regulator [Atribacterota bacterium]|nr:GntR family transcriptional regulator [Atribacterota bacterium]